ncbi:glucose 1-dehydrogenase [Vreelandella populi]|uniref:Glucose 1-dehydrogenase n=1 Tax=Vreelandella populi TaxID=2498858 RepID=A0A433LH60_9GAMM|nr:glucose 1-dehydrogenase [Halomonas populi]RUR40832.1 glucose 1-dehydrogenase [Halomonas populi]RUR49339.1 glucose 1-dehydrogenase [Halomonas populi]
MNKVAIITGGGRGIGAATSLLLAAKGYAVCINYVKNQPAAESVAARITEAGGSAMTFQADVSAEDEVQALFEAAQQRLGRVTHLVNNAGILFTQSALADISPERFQKVLNANVMSAFLCSKAFIHQAEGAGAIVNVSSAAARTGSPFEYIDYAASKGAMDSMTKGLSIELAARNIRVNSVRPGFIHTDMHADGGEPRRVERLAPQIPLKRGGTPEEVAQAIVWLLSDEASYVTGSFIDVAGGR